MRERAEARASELTRARRCRRKPTGARCVEKRSFGAHHGGWRARQQSHGGAALQDAGGRLPRLPAVDQAGLQAKLRESLIVSGSVTAPPGIGCACASRISPARRGLRHAEAARRRVDSVSGGLQPKHLGWRAACLLGLAWGYPWMHPHHGGAPARALGPPLCSLTHPKFFEHSCRPCGWKSAGAAPGRTQSRRECCAAPAGPASWDGGAVVAERLCVNVRKRAQASSHAHAAAAGSPQAPGMSKRGALAPTKGGGATGSRVTVVPQCKMRDAACRACPLWTRQGYKRSSESP